MKWPEAAANSRTGRLESMVAVTAVLVVNNNGRPYDTVLRKALGALLTPSVAEDGSVEAKEALRWLEDRSVQVSALADSVLVRAALDQLGKTAGRNHSRGRHPAA